MTEGRFGKATNRLLQNEQTLQKEKSLYKRLGKVLPEETVKIPKIGEWELTVSDNPNQTNAQNSKQRNTNNKENANNASMARSKSGMSAPFSVKPPKVSQSSHGYGESRVQYPNGTATTDISDILKSKFRAPSKPLPPLKSDFLDDPQFLPLEVFDDSTYEEFTLDELMKDPIAYSRFQEIDGDNYWAKCTVLSYDEKTGLFLIEWDGTGKRKKVARFNLRFEREDREKFEKRIIAAKKSCALFETSLRFQSRITQMPRENLPVISPEDLEEIHFKINQNIDMAYQRVLYYLDEEIREEFKTINNMLAFQYELQHNPLIPNRNEFLMLMPSLPIVKESGLAASPYTNFDDALNKVTEMHLLANPHYRRGIFTIWNIFQDSEGLTLLNYGYSETISLEEFVNRQNTHLEQTTHEFKRSIQDTLEGVLSTTVSDHASTLKPKEKLQYQSMVTLTARMLHTVLLRIVDSTLSTYLLQFIQYSDPDNTPERSEPQFSISLVLEAEGHINYIPTLDEFQQELLQLLSSLETSVVELPNIKSALFEVDTSSVSFSDCSDIIQSKKIELEKIIQVLFSQMRRFLTDRLFLEQVLSIDPLEYTRTFDPNGNKSLDEYRNQLSEFNRMLNVVQNETSNDYQLGIFHLSCSEFKSKSVAHIQTLIFNFLSHVKTLALDAITDLQNEFSEITLKLKKIPQTPEELSDIKKYLEHVYDSVKMRNKKMAAANEKFSFLEEFQFGVDNDEFQYRYQTLQMPQKISVLMDETERTLSVERIRMIRELRSNQRKLESESTVLSDQLTSFASKYSDLEMTVEAVDQINDIEKRLQVFKDEQDTYNKHEKLFDFEQGANKVLQKLIEEFSPLHQLWNLANEWLNTYTQWLDTPFPQIKADSITQFMVQSNKKINKLRKELVSQPLLVEKVLNPLVVQIETFKHNVPLVTRLRHPGIKTKHWEMITQVVGFSVVSSMELSLQGFLDLKLDKWNEQIIEIASVAAQEYSLESSLDQMDAELQTKMFSSTVFRDSERYILTEIDDIISTIDDQLVTTQTILTSPFIAPVKKRAIERLTFLRSSRDVLELWVSCQKSWLYLQPIFTGTSIQQKLHKEARDWSSVDKLWTAIMTLTHNHPAFMNVMHRDNLPDHLKQCNELLDSITKGLNAYLESKRIGFPRFFFLSNDELISILSNSKDFSKMQESMQKLFEYVNTITVNKEQMITHIKDIEGETVRLKTPVDTDVTEIEDWLNSFEDEIKSSMKEYINQSIVSYNKKKREYWLAEFPAQVVLIVNQIMWTQQVSTVLKGQKLRGMKVLQQKYIEQLEQLTAMIRQPVSHLIRQIVSCLLIFEVHNRDIIQYFITNEVSDIESFQWIQQLRYYFEDDTVYVRCINNSYEYSYEYAGNSSRLVITPLTDRCYQTLLSAFKQFLSGAPSGPAGTGKTETVRDCAKALGRPCVVYNCSEEVTPEQMSQFFAGLSASGSWSCFDEFNRINIEVLSVIAQQVRTIQSALSSNVETFILDQRTLRLNQNAGICITMNPGYAGRTELPDNLKALFRPCAMMVPDFVFISEILLYSGGFATASTLSVKLVALFDLCRKQLSNSHHYDWGLRAMKAILSTAGKAKRQDLESDESVLLVRTIKDITAPKLISSDLPLFNAIIKDVFPSVNIQKNSPTSLSNEIKNQFSLRNLQSLPSCVSKSIELYETMLVRHGNMLVGSSMGGKSTSWKVLSGALNSLSSNGQEKPVHIETINPKAISIGELYGAFNPITSEWSDGVLSKCIRECSFSDTKEQKWIVVDGPVDSLWIESMNSLLDDNKVLCLANNERIQLGPHVRLLFEVDNLNEASPATVSRCGMVYFDPSSLPWTAIADSWMNKNEARHPLVTKFLRELMNLYIPGLMQFIVADAKASVQINPNFALMNLLRLLSCFYDVDRSPQEKTTDGDELVMEDPLNHSLYFSLFSSPGETTIPYMDETQITLAFERCFIFAVVWAFGGILIDESRVLFDRYLKDLCDTNQCRCPFPVKTSVFELYADIPGSCWSPWIDENPDQLLGSNLEIESQLIPTNESASILFINRLLTTHGYHSVIQGPESGKSLVMESLLKQILDQKTYDCHILPIAHCTTAVNISRFIRSFLHKKQGKLSPLPNQNLIVMMDNINSVKPEEYGAQPPLELLRQFMDYDGWYNTSPVEFISITGTTIVATMGVPGGGLFNIPERLMRHFYFMHIPKYSHETVEFITYGLMNHCICGVSSSIKELLRPASAALVDIYFKCVAKLLPIPSKQHYVFSYRSIIRVIKGIMLVESASLSDNHTFIKLWYHEIAREFCDKLNTNNDREWFTQIESDACVKHFKVSWESISNQTIPMFNGISDSSRKYKEVINTQDRLLQSCNNMLEEHNRDEIKQLDIILFNEAVERLSTLSRSLYMPHGNILLVGVKSSGRKSLTRLALHIANIQPYEIVITRSYSFLEWRDDMKNLMKQCGIKDINTGFIITGSQIIIPQQLEDISNLLTKCQIPLLFEREEIDMIKAEIVQADVLDPSIDPWEIFIERIQKNLHLIIVMSPYGNAFKDAMLYYPAIRNETTIDWYMPWSQNALESVGKAQLSKINIQPLALFESVVSICVRIHRSVEEFASRFFKETKRFTAVTPARYFDLLNSLRNKFERKKKDNHKATLDYANGIEKIKTTQVQISRMREQLDRDIPVLQKMEAEVETILEELHVKRAEVEVTKEEVLRKSEIAAVETKEAAESNRIAQEQFARAQPILAEAQDAVQRLDKDSLVNIKKLHQPSGGMKDTFEAICIMFERQPRKVDGPTPGTKEDDYWPEFVSLLNDIQFIKNITSFKIESMKKDTINRLRKYVPENKQVRAEKKKAAVASFQAIGAMYDWVCASFEYWQIYQEILPMRIAADEAAKKLEISEALLEKARKHLAEVEANLKQLEDRVIEMRNKEKELKENVDRTEARLLRANRIMSGLSGETDRWSVIYQNLQDSSQYILGDSILISGVLTYLGAFSPSYRSQMLESWKRYLSNESIPFTDNFSIAQSLGNDAMIRDWIAKGLPNDTHSIENALIITQDDSSFPLLIDPQMSGTKWIRSLYGDRLIVLRFDQSDFVQRLKSCIAFGSSVLIENVGMKFDPLIDPILSREIITNEGQKSIVIAGETVNYADSFRLFISTKYPNPQYSPEVCSQISLINFTTTQYGLTDLLLNNLIEVEREDLDKKRIQIMEASAENVRRLKQIEADILRIVSNAGSDILDDDAAINTLQNAQKTSSDIAQQMAASESTEKQIMMFKQKFYSVAERASLLYFCVSDFSVIDPMYQFSLKWFVNVFRNAITKSNRPSDSIELIASFHQSVAQCFYESVSFSLFSRHKLLFSTLLVIRIMYSEKQISSNELAFLLSPSPSKEPNQSFLPDEIWSLIVTLSSVSPQFSSLLASLKTHEKEWKTYYESPNPEKMVFPLYSTLSSFQKFLVLRVFHLERVREGLFAFIEENMGKSFVTPPTLNLLNVFKESSPLSPLVFITMPGIDPQDEILSVASTMELEKYIKSYSLGRGRGAGAEELIIDSAERGFWVLLQNCHLSLSWMPKLEQIINNLDPQKVHKRFRLCLVTMSSPDFPIGILYQGTKLIYEIPKGMRENVLRIYNSFNVEEYNNSDSEMEKQMTFNLSFFHAIVLERLQFGSIGWNIPYEFNPSDFSISRKHLKTFLSEATSGEIPFEALSYVIGELNYGGRVTDSWDRRLLLSLLRRNFNEDSSSSFFVNNNRYVSPDFNSPISSLIQCVSSWPVVTQGEDVGLSKNASTITARNESLKIFGNLLEVQPTLVAASDSITEEQYILSLIESLVNQIPNNFNIASFKKKFDPNDTLTTVLHHEIVLYNNLLSVIRESLNRLENGMRGMILIDEKLEILSRRILSNKVPEEWLDASYPSVLSLRNYMNDLRQRVEFLDHWVRLGRPIVFKLGAFYHPEEFLTAILQHHARKHQLPLDSLTWITTPLDIVNSSKITSEPQEGIFIEGLPIEGAKFDIKTRSLIECSQMDLINYLPVTHLLPTTDKSQYQTTSIYECPVYRTQQRGTGALDLPNYIFSIYLPSKTETPDHWIQRSVGAYITFQ